MKLKCRIFGHEPTGLITGFTTDGKAITRCECCNRPIVSGKWCATNEVQIAMGMYYGQLPIQTTIQPRDL